MASTFQTTGSGGTGLPYSNVSRLQLEQVRKADFYAGAKALTVGDSGNSADTTPFAPLGQGDINAEQFYTEQSTLLDNVYTLTPNPSPGTVLGYIGQVGDVVSETVNWYGPTFRETTICSVATGTTITLATGTFSSSIVAGDIAILSGGVSFGSGASNAYAVGAVVSGGGTGTLTLTGIVNTYNGGGTTLSIDSDKYPVTIVQPTAIKLFAYPGSGPTTGEEQTYFAVLPTSTLHSVSAPTTGQINADRITSVVPPNYNLNNPNPAVASVDAADSVYGSNQPRTTAALLGYRWMVYPDNGGSSSGSGAPNLASPITPTAVIDPSPSLSGDQRLTFDYEAGILRLSCAPKIGGAFKVTGGTDQTTGRMVLWAVFWAIDQESTIGTARGLYALRSTYAAQNVAGRVYYDLSDSIWRIGQTTTFNEFVVQADDGKLVDPTYSTRFGAWQITGASPFRGFIWTQQGETSGKGMGLITHDPWIGGDAPPVVTVADKTSVTIGDLSSPPQNPGADYNAPYTFNHVSNVGARDAFEGLSNAISGIAGQAGSQLRTIHLHQGRYYAGIELVVPPNTLIEGEGNATKIIQRELDSGLTPIFKFGPNTTHGVYDYGAAAQLGTGDGLTASPITQVNLGSSPVIEGLACVWNPVRRVWGYVFADLGTNTIFFNEADSSGAALFSGYGAPVNQTPITLFSTASPNSQYHTPCHYPRIAYHEHTDTYAVVWVEQVVAGLTTVGPAVKLMQFGVTLPGGTLTNPIAAALKFSYGTTPAVMPSVYNSYLIISSAYDALGNVDAAFFDHPSVCVDSSNVNSDYTVTIAAWGYSQLANGYINTNASSGAVRAQFSNMVATGFAYSAVEAVISDNSPFVVSSTDIKDDGQGGYFGGDTLRLGIPLFSTTGTFSVSGGVGTLTDTGLPAGMTFVDFTGQESYTACKFIYLYSGATSSGTGYDGFINNPSLITTSLTIVPQDDMSALGVTWANATGNLNYAIIPRTCLSCWRYIPGSGAVERYAAIAGGILPGFSEYAADQSETDFIRVCQGDGGWLVTYQAFNTTGFLSRTNMQNFSGGPSAPFTVLNGNFLDNFITMQSTEVFREHISTCAVVVSDSLNVIAPLASQQLGTNNGALPSRDLAVTLRSLGARDPVTFRPNMYNQTASPVRGGRSQDRQIAASNFFMRWNPAVGANPSLIPDVAWTGQDWVVVSPAKDQVHSKLGFYQTVSQNSVAVAYLTDGTFYFGANGPGQYWNSGTSAYAPVDGNWLLQTVVLNEDLIYFPPQTAIPAGGQATIVGIHSEHTVILDSNPFGFPPAEAAGNVEWVLIRASGGQTAGIKNPGFRVAADGRRIVSSAFITHADHTGDLEIGQGIPNSTVMTIRRPGPDGHNLPGTITTDFADPDARILANLTFHGVAVGGPKPTNCALTEQPMVALAWNDMGYGFLQRYCSDIAKTSSALQLFYQNFGPYNSGLKDLQIVTAQKRTSTQQTTNPTNLEVLSSKKVFTRHVVFGALNINGDFATDGYRNCFVSTGSGASQMHGTGSGNVPLPSDLAMMAYYTDVLGDNAIRKQGPSTLDNATRKAGSGAAQQLIYPNEFGDGATISPTGTFGWASPAYSPNLAGTPKVIWDGQRFIAVWIEQMGWESVPYGTGAGVGAFICCAVFPGDEDQALQSSELTDPYSNDTTTSLDGLTFSFINQFPSEIMRVSVGSTGVQTFQLDVATSGKTVAVLWTGGLDPNGGGSSSSSPDSSGSGLSQIGLVMFDLTSYIGNPQDQYENGSFLPGSGTSYGILGTGATGSNGFAYPKIIWDGHQFVAMSVMGDNTVAGAAIANQLVYQVIPEHGLSRGMQIKNFGNALEIENYVAVGNGTNQIFLNDTAATVQPGDIVFLGVATTGGNLVSGYPLGGWLVIDYNPSTHSVYLDANNFNFGTSAIDYTGFIIGGAGLGNQYLAQGFGYPTGYEFGGSTQNALAMSGTITGPASYVPNVARPVSRLCGLVYNETNDEYAFLYLAGSTPGAYMIMQTFKRGTTTAAPTSAVELTPPSGFQAEEVRVASLAWNGRNYLVSYITYVPSTGSAEFETLEYMLLSPTLQVLEQGVLAANTAIPSTGAPFTLVGNNPGQVPGPLYQNGSANSWNSNALVQPRLRNTKVVWNNRLNRWVVSCSLFWYDNIPAVNGSGHVNVPQMYLSRAGQVAYSGGTTWAWASSTNNITTSGNFYVQPGCKLSLYNLGTHVQASYFTVDSYVNGTSFNVDVLSNEVGSPTDTLIMEQNFREDVFCFTLGSSVPGVKIHDADNITLDNITFSGPGADIEEKYMQMGRPIWQSGGPANGVIQGTGSVSTVYPYYRAGQFNHAFLTPTMKVNLPRYTNVRSTTQLKFGSGLSPGYRVVDRYLFDGANRRG